ncbi:MFS transporter [Streptomyces sp. I05A-00742]|uniref:MFS transporter n=1 Tax=Streptomyces sp. I05A-00742 TaxID=2732853 RepID=UPI001489FC53|nr:MFS transporter [Streptomyces sp. I05A-00742]
MADLSQASKGSDGRGLSALVAIGAASVLASLDLFVVNLAFSSISASFPSASPQAMTWVLNAYGVVFAALLVPSGRLADRFGRKRLFRLGLLVFACGSLGAAIAPEAGTLIVARGTQGAGAALIVPTSLALLLSAYPQERHKRMVSLWAATGSVAAAAGPVLGGVLTRYDWRWIFVINVPIAITGLVLAANLKETATLRTRVPDLLGSALLVTGVGALVTAVSYVTEWGLADPWLWSVLATGLLALVWFLRRCLTHVAPAVDLRVFRAPSFTVATLGMTCFYIGFSIMLLGCSLFLTDVWEWDPVPAGLGFASGPATAVITAVIAGRASLEPHRLAGLGSTFFVAAGALWFFFLTERTGYFPVYFAGTVLTGAGAGIAQTGFLAGGVGGLPAQEYATGTGVLNACRQIGGAIGVAILIAVTGGGHDANRYRIAWAVMAAAGLIAALSALALREPPAPSAHDAPLPSMSRTPRGQR